MQRTVWRFSSRQDLETLRSTGSIVSHGKGLMHFHLKQFDQFDKHFYTLNLLCKGFSCVCIAQQRVQRKPSEVRSRSKSNFEILVETKVFCETRRVLGVRQSRFGSRALSWPGKLAWRQWTVIPHPPQDISGPASLQPCDSKDGL